MNGYNIGKPDMVRKLKNLCHLLVAVVAVIFYRYPAKDLRVIAVTGTDGKTTTVHLIYDILQQAGKKSAMISSVAAHIGKQTIDTGFHVTTPSAWALQKLLRRIKDKGCEYVVLEATSHGLDQHRVFGANFLVGVLTNVTHEHLDYHGTYKNYLEAKAKLFEGVKVAVLNRDDESYAFLKSKVKSQKSKVITYSLKHKADLTKEICPCESGLRGEYNYYNALAAIGAARAVGIDDQDINEAIVDFDGVAGRMEDVGGNQDFKVIVDFAHTPNALEKLLETLKGEVRKGRVVVVFGCAGLRDTQKRPLMGEVAARLADIAVLTAEDPRTENMNEIIDQIAVGSLKGGAKELDPLLYKDLDSSGHIFFRVPDRKRAINFAIRRLARRNDVVVICGKGHEKSMCYGTIEYPWSDHKTAKEALEKR